MIDWAVKFYTEHTNTLLYFAYLLPLIINAVLYSIKSVKEYKRDLRASLLPYYTPCLTIGSILGRIIASLLPAVNVIALVRNIPNVLTFLGEIFYWLYKFFSIPLVGNRFIEESKKK